MMARKPVTDELWEVIEPLLPEETPKPKGGWPRVDDRAALTETTSSKCVGWPTAHAASNASSPRA